MHAADGAAGLLPLVDSVVARPSGTHGPRPGQEGREALGDGHRTGTRSPATVRGGERLVQVHVDDVEAHVARPGHAQDGVEIGAVVIKQPADPVDGRRDGGDVLLEEAQGVRVGQHDAGHLVVEDAVQGGHVDAATGVARHRDGLVSAKGHRGRVGAMCRVGNDHLGPHRSLGLVPRPHEQQAGELPGGTGCRLQRRGCHPGDGTEGFLELDEKGEPPLDERCRCRRMHAGQSGQGGDCVAHLGVVLHGAGAERVGARGRPSTAGGTTA